MITQPVTGAARLKLMTSSLVDASLLPLRPQSDFFNSAFCKGNRVTLQPAKKFRLHRVSETSLGWLGALLQFCLPASPFFSPFFFSF